MFRTICPKTHRIIFGSSLRDEKTRQVSCREAKVAGYKESLLSIKTSSRNRPGVYPGFRQYTQSQKSSTAVGPERWTPVEENTFHRLFPQRALFTFPDSRHGTDQAESEPSSIYGYILYPQETVRCFIYHDPSKLYPGETIHSMRKCSKNGYLFPAEAILMMERSQKQTTD